MTAPQPLRGQQTRVNWFDKQFSQIGWPMLIALMILFTVLMWIFSGIGLLVTKTPVAHRRAKIVFIISTIYLACCGIAIYVMVHHPELLKLATARTADNSPRCGLNWNSCRKGSGQFLVTKCGKPAS